MPAKTLGLPTRTVQKRVSRRQMINEGEHQQITLTNKNCKYCVAHIRNLFVKRIATISDLDIDRRSIFMEHATQGLGSDEKQACILRQYLVGRWAMTYVLEITTIAALKKYQLNV